MGFLKRKNQQGGKPEPVASEPSGDEADESRRVGYSASMERRMRRLGSYSYDFEDTDPKEVEARIRRMFYGAKVEDD